MANAFEVRLEVLKMAKELSVEQYYQDRDAIMAVWEREANLAAERQMPVPLQPKFPDFPSTDAVLRKAKELNEFVSVKQT